MASLQPKKKKHQKLNSVIVFLIAFVLFLLVFGGLCLWAFVRINEERRGEASEPASVVSQAGPVFTEEDAGNLLVVTVDDSAARGFIVVHSDPLNTRIRTLAVPRETAVDVGTEQQRLFELYAKQGVQEAEAAVGRLLGLEFGNYAVITYENVEKYISRLSDGLIFTLPEDLNYQDPEGKASIKLEGGPRTLTASQVVNVMRYPNWYGGRKQQADVQAQLLAALINQYLLPARDLQSDFETLTGVIQSDIKISHFTKAKTGLEYLASRNTEGAICSSVSLEGSYVGTGEAIRFEMADSANSSLRIVFNNSH